MPELPEVETLRRSLEPHIVGKTIEKVLLRRPDLRIAFPPLFAERLSGRKIIAVRRRAKYIIVDIEDGLGWLIHLGMSGSVRLQKSGDQSGSETKKGQESEFFSGEALGSSRRSGDRSGSETKKGQESDVFSGLYPTGRAMHGRRDEKALGSSRRSGDRSGSETKIKPHDHVIANLSDNMQMIYHDPRRFGLMTLMDKGEEEVHPLLTHLGVEPLSDGFTVKYLRKAFAKKTAPIKHVLMDQQVVVGVGNIYACEALFRAGIHPQTPTQDCTKLEALVVAVKEVLEAAITAGGSTLRDYVNAQGESGYFQHSFDVYARENKPCVQCGAEIKRIVQQGRSTFYCAVCQPL